MRRLEKKRKMGVGEGNRNFARANLRPAPAAGPQTLVSTLASMRAGPSGGLSSSSWTQKRTLDISLEQKIQVYVPFNFKATGPSSGKGGGKKSTLLLCKRDSRTIHLPSKTDPGKQFAKDLAMKGKQLRPLPLMTTCLCGITKFTGVIWDCID